MLWLKKKEKVSNKLKEAMIKAIDELDMVDLSSDDAKHIADNLKILSESLSNIEKAEQANKAMAKDIIVGAASACIDAGSKIGVELMRENCEMRLLNMKVGAREDELVACLAQENGKCDLSIEKINASPTLKKYFNNNGIKL